MEINPTNEQIAAWIEDRKIGAWWYTHCPVCGVDGSWHDCKCKSGNAVWQYTGPDFYTPAACAEFVEPVILDVSQSDFLFKIVRHSTLTEIERAARYEGDYDWEVIASHKHHPTACALALAKIMEGK